MKYASLRRYVQNGKFLYEWIGDEFLPINLGEEYFIYRNFYKDDLPYPGKLKVIYEKRECIPPIVIAVRTDSQPLWWVWIKAQLYIEKISYRINRYLLYTADKFNLLNPEEGQYLSWNQLKIFKHRRIV